MLARQQCSATQHPGLLATFVVSNPAGGVQAAQKDMKKVEKAHAGRADQQSTRLKVVQRREKRAKAKEEEIATTVASQGTLPEIVGARENHWQRWTRRLISEVRKSRARGNSK